MDIERNVDQATTDIENIVTGQKNQLDEDAQIQHIQVPKASLKDFCAHFGKGKNFKHLFGAAYSWFALDVRLKLLLLSVRSSLSPQITLYGLGLNSGIILQTIGFGGPFSGNAVEAVYQNLVNISIGNMILSAAGLIPGYYVSFILIDSWGRKPIQLMGFTILAMIYIIMGMSPLNISFALFSLDASSRLRIQLPYFHYRQPEFLCIPLLSRRLLPELWSQCHHLRHSRRNVPNQISFNR